MDVDVQVGSTVPAVVRGATEAEAEAEEAGNQVDVVAAVGARHAHPRAREGYTLGVLYGSACYATCISGGIDLFTVEMARGGAVV